MNDKVLTAKEVAEMIIDDRKSYGGPLSESSSMSLDDFEWPTKEAIEQELLNRFQLEFTIQFTDSEILYKLVE
ncbi:hypothetical protein BH09PAT2_BH09PAT2_09100 [soil metagenome]